MELLLQDWLAAVFTVFVVLGTLAVWAWALTRKIDADKPSGAVPHLFMLIIVTALAVGVVSLTWGGRAYFLAHRTEANNAAAAEKEREIMATPDVDENLVEKIRKQREEKEKEKRLAEERRKTQEARQKSEEYLKSLEGKETK